MTQSQTLTKLRRVHWRALQRLVKQAYQEGYESGLRRAHGESRRGRTIRSDATVDGLVRLIERHFGLGRYRLRGADRPRLLRAPRAVRGSDP